MGPYVWNIYRLHNGVFMRVRTISVQRSLNRGPISISVDEFACSERQYLQIIYQETSAAYVGGLEFENNADANCHSGLIINSTFFISIMTEQPRAQQLPINERSIRQSRYCLTISQNPQTILCGACISQIRSGDSSIFHLPSSIM